uniref:Major facilitator superfamily (MFS) profile domain-containing protein n=1 Tax=Parascaris univalens TaxID=6257 RepID=A0A915BRT2_PARUN
MHETADSPWQQPLSSNNEQLQPPLAFRVYRRRWIVVAVVAMLASSNSMLWIAFAAVDNHVTAFYHSKAAWFAVVYLIFTVPSGIVAMSLDRRVGLRGSLMIAAWTNVTGAVLRFISSFLSDSLRFPCGLAGQVLAAWAYPFIMFLPTKIANTWFSPNERAIATTIATMSNPLGVFSANIISPLIVRKAVHVRILNGVLVVSPLIACAAALVGLTESQPQVPPSFSAAQAEIGFRAGLKRCLTSRSYLLLLITMGGGNAMFTSVYSIIHILLCPSGYSNGFIGFCGALMIGCGIVGAMVSGVLASRTKCYEQIMKISVAFTVLSFLLFLQLTLHPHMEWLLAIAAAMFGIFGLAAYPVGLELAAECTFPASQTISMGLVVISGQAFAVALLQVVRMTARRLQYDYMHIQSCTTDEAKTIVPLDNTFPVMIVSAVGTAIVIIFFALYRPNYKRSILERRNQKRLADANPAQGQMPKQETPLDEVNVEP